MEGKYVLHAKDCVLLEIDIQEGRLLDQMPEREKLLQNSSNLIKIADLLGIPVVVTEQYPKGIGPTARTIKESLPENTPVIEKVSFDACTKEVMEVLGDLGRNKVLVVGMETHICIYQTSRTLLQQGYQVHLVSDAVQSRFPENRENGLNLLRDLGAVVTNFETVVFDLLKKAGTPEFKKVLPLLK